jgi:outer membrane protein assembly factor BamB
MPSLFARTGCLFAALLLVSTAQADDWPQFGRNSTRNAVSPEKNPPLDWELGDPAAKPATPPKNIRWSSDGLFASGRSLGEPVVTGGMVWISSVRRLSDKSGDSLATLLCLDEKSGKLLFQYDSPRHPAGRVIDYPGSSFNCSPLVDGRLLWTVTNRGEILCLDILPLQKRIGEPIVVWNFDLQKQLGVFPSTAGDFITLRRCSIAGHGEFLYTVTGNGVDDGFVLKTPEAPSLVCLEKKTGKVVWSDKSPGKNIMAGQTSSPLILEDTERTQVIVGQGDGWVRSFDSRTGRLLWEYDTNPKDAKFVPGNGLRNSILATPVLYKGRVYIGNGHMGEFGPGAGWLHCIDPTKRGDISPELPGGPGGKGKPNPNSGRVWRYGGGREKFGFMRFCRTVSNVVIDRDIVIAPSVDGRVHCVDAGTGERHWVLDTIADGAFRTSPLIVDGHVYFTDCNDVVWIVELAKTLKIEAQIDMDGCHYSSPIFANGALYLRAGGRLHAISVR